MIIPMTPAHAAAICGWVHKNEYAVYNFIPGEPAMRELMNTTYYACLGPDQNLTGYFCFGASAQIPAVEADAYEPPIPDIGLGMKPFLCGQGNGAAFVQSGLAFAKARYHRRQTRLTVAAWNARAIRTYEKLGFQNKKSITHRKTQQKFYIMIYTDESEETP
jgi:[ribosomal protein S18]-alanine N-acetyltransferase